MKTGKQEGRKEGRRLDNRETRRKEGRKGRGFKTGKQQGRKGGGLTTGACMLRGVWHPHSSKHIVAA